MLRRPGTEPRQIIRAWVQRLGSLRLSPSGWVAMAGLALANWLADAAVLAVSIRATGAVVPWHVLPAGLRFGYRGAEPQHHARWAGGH